MGVYLVGHNIDSPFQILVTHFLIDLNQLHLISNISNNIVNNSIDIPDALIKNDDVWE